MNEKRLITNKITENKDDNNSKNKQSDIISSDFTNGIAVMMIMCGYPYTQYGCVSDHTRIPFMIVWCTVGTSSVKTCQ